jgi:hypothetical protein
VLLRKSECLYTAIVNAKPGTSLGTSIRDGVPFDKLSDGDKLACALAVSGYDKALAVAVEELAKVDAASTNGTAPAGAGDAKTEKTKKGA